MDVPGWICHYDIEFSQDLEVEETQIAVDPFCIFHPFSDHNFFLSCFPLLIFLNIVDQFAIRIVAGVQMGAIPETLVSLLVDNCSEMFFGAV